MSPRNAKLLPVAKNKAFEALCTVLTDELEPKFGLQWDVTERLRVRVAFLETVKPALVVQQSIEPTHVASFNQLFDDKNGTRADRYGIGIDAQLFDGLLAGVEASHRDLKVPIFNGETLIAELIEEHDEDLYLAYLYWTPHVDWAFTADYEFERFDRVPSTDFDTPLRTETISLPVTAQYFSPTGLFGKLRATYVHQEVVRDPRTVFDSGTEDFPVVDAIVGYRLPKRWGVASIEVRSIFDEEFRFQDVNFQTSEPRDPRFIPDRALLAQITLHF